MYTTKAYWFYKNLLAPVLEGNVKVKNLLIIPDGELGHLPFETFLTQRGLQTYKGYQDLSYMLKTYSISYNYSATLWAESIKQKNQQNNSQILLWQPAFQLKQIAQFTLGDSPQNNV